VQVGCTIRLTLLGSQKAVKDYSHFCQTPHCTHQHNCKKCPLYTKAEEDDATAMRAAGYAALQKVAQLGVPVVAAAAAAGNGGAAAVGQADGTSVAPSIDVESLLK
jgi:hypothetical protein